MKIRSAKNKGQRAVKELRDALLKTFPELSPDDLRPVPASVNGSDVWQSAKAKQLLGCKWEVKNCEKLNVWKAFEQATKHEGEEIPVLVFRRNRTEPLVALPLEAFLTIFRKSIDGKESYVSCAI